MKPFMVMVSACVAMACGAQREESPRPRADNAPTLSSDAHKPRSASEPRSALESAATPTVVLTGADGTTHKVLVELARTTAERRRGLMYRQHLAPDRGMFFIFEDMAERSFWMKNTLIPLDIIFIRQDLTILGIVPKAAPQTTTARRVAGKSMYVLEVVAGFATAHGIETDSKLQVENFTL